MLRHAKEAGLRILTLAIRVASALALLALLACLLPAWMAGSASAAGDGTCGTGVEHASRSWYFAEGYTGPGFQEWLCVMNPGDSLCRLDIQLLYNGGQPRLETVGLPPLSRTTLNVNQLAGEDRELSLKLESERPVVAERPMYFTYRGKWRGCTVGAGVNALSRTWHFPEGCTREGFEEWILLSNPGDEEVPVNIRFILGDGGVRQRALRLAPLSRSTVFVNREVGEGMDVSAQVLAEEPICAERVMYFFYHGAWQGGHASSGLASARQRYLFAEGYTGPGFEEWLCLYAPEGAEVWVTCIFESGEERSFPVRIGPLRRHTLNVNQLAGRSEGVSLEIWGDKPFLAERPMYFNYRGFCRGGHVSTGVEEPSTSWYLAEGTTRAGFHPYLCILNPQPEDAQVVVSLLDGAEGTAEREFTAPGRARLTVNLLSLLPRGLDFSIRISSNLPVVAERPLYFPGADFEVLNAMDHIRHLSLDLGPRVEGTEQERRAAEDLASTLRGYGYRVTVQEVPLPNGNFTRNVVASLDELEDTSSTPRKPLLVVGGHYDTKAGTGSPGANDNASGTAVVMELARCFAETGTRHLQPVFVLFGGEERLVDGTDLHHFGSRYFVSHLSARNRERMMGAIIVDMVGVGSQLYARTMGVGPMSLCDSLLAYASRSGIRLPYQRSGSYSDHEPFEAAGIPAVWLEVKDDPWYHTPADSVDKIDPSHIEITGRLLQGFISQLDASK